MYSHPAKYANEHGELEQYRASHKANIACKEAIEAAIRDHYRDNSLGSGAVRQVVEQFGEERMLYVLANTIQQKDWDGRFSQDNKTWAKTIPVCENPDGFGNDRRSAFVVDAHPGLTDLFVKQARKEHLAERQKKPSVLEKLKQGTPSPQKAAEPKKTRTQPER